MSYRIEGKDIVISGFNQGIADSPYDGIADIRNIDINSMPTEAFVNFKMAAATKPPVMDAVAYTAQNSGDTITIASTTGLYVGCAIKLANNTAGGLSNGVVYYVFNITATTFQIRLAPASGSAINISSDGTGDLTTYQYGNQRGVSSGVCPVSYFVDRTGELAGSNAIYLMDRSNYAWVILPADQGSITANTLIFLGNIGGVGASVSTASAIAVWNDYIFIFGTTTQGTDVGDLSDIWVSAGPAATWSYTWQSPDCQSTANRIGLIVSQEDGNIYFTSSTGIGSLIETPGDVFDPTDPVSYTLESDAISLPTTDGSVCLAELGSFILIGGRNSLVYVWDKVSLGFNTILNISDTFITNIVAVSQNAYVFAGTRGRIYITNGSSINLYKKIPDYVTGTVNPYIRWRDANFNRDQLYFTFSATSNSGSDLTTVNGAWAIDLNTDALRLLNKITESGYSGSAGMVVEMPASSSTTWGNRPVGSGLVIGWNVSTTYGVDVSSSEPYSSFESFIDTEFIPVGTFLKPFSPSQIEWKTAVPLGGNGTSESIRISYRLNLSSSFTVINTSTSTTGLISDLYKVNFQKAQWIQLRIEMSSNSTTPTYNRLTEVRIRDWPSS